MASSAPAPQGSQPALTTGHSFYAPAPPVAQPPPQQNPEIAGWYAPQPEAPPHTRPDQSYLDYRRTNRRAQEQFLRQNPPAVPDMITVPLSDGRRLWEKTKMVLHVFVMAFASAAFGLTITLAKSKYKDGVIFGTIAVSIVAFFWSGIDFFSRVARARWISSGIHPGFHVFLSLGILAATAAIAVVGGIFLQEHRDDTNKSDQCTTRLCRIRDRDDDYDQTIATTAIVFTGLIALVHVVLFVGACIDSS